MIAVSKVGFPFNKVTPQKFFIRHTSRQFFTNGIREFNDSGYLIIPMDRRLYESSKYVENFSMISNLAETCLHKFQRDQEFCRMPIFYPREFSMGFHYLNGAEPRETAPRLKIHKLNDSIIGDEIKYYEFNIEGPNVILVNIIPTWNAKLIKWNLHPPISDIPNFAPPYIVHFSYADKQLNHTLKLFFHVRLNSS